MGFTEHTKLRKEKFGTVLFDTLTEKIFITDQVGTHILEFIAKGIESSEIANQLCDIYDGDEQTIQKDTMEFIAELKLNNMIVI